jgi:DNA-binding GntR family transcriptional regulator
MKGLQKIGRGNLSAMVYEQLRSALMSGYYAPGQRLTLVDLASELGTSVTPVREAIFRLAADGALEMPKAQTIAVPVLSEASVAELKMIRIHLEGEAAAAAALKATRKEVAKIRRINEAFFNALDQGDPHQASNYNREFHLAVVALAEMPIVLTTVEMMWARMGAHIHRINLGRRRLRDYGPDHEHYGVISGLELRDADLARQSIQNDIKFGQFTFLDVDVEATSDHRQPVVSKPATRPRRNRSR